VSATGQPIISLGAALIGFAGVIITMLFNAWMGRKAREDERKHWQRVLAAALLAELQLIQESFTQNAIDLDAARQDGNGGPAYLPHKNWALVFEHVVKDVGLLPIDAARAVVEAHMSLATYFQKLMLIATIEHLDQTPDFVLMPLAHLGTVAEMNRRLLPCLSDAITALRTAT
jgi:hypothetical protein